MLPVLGKIGTKDIIGTAQETEIWIGIIDTDCILDRILYTGKHPDAGKD